MLYDDGVCPYTQIPRISPHVNIDDFATGVYTCGGIRSSTSNTYKLVVKKETGRK